MAKRVFLIVLDSAGIGELPDAADYGDKGSNTFKACFDSGKLNIPNMGKIGFFCIDGIDYGPASDRPVGAMARMAERSRGKDTTIGHWEIGGYISRKPLPTFPDGFPAEVLEAFEKATGRGVLCNKPYSGTAVIADYGEEHIKTGKLIVYTSADSVFQIAAHEDVVPVETLYKYCEAARAILKGDFGVGRVIARPFTGTHPFKRTTGRHDFSLVPPAPTMLDYITKSGRSVISIGKIVDIFANRGITESYRTVSNDEGVKKTLEMIRRDNFEGLCFTNLVDFDMLYGHRNDVAGYTDALSRFDEQLGEIMSAMGNEDVLMITADHGCDPSTPSTDHSREYTPLLMYGKEILPYNYGTRETFADIAATVLKLLGVHGLTAGISLL